MQLDRYPEHLVFGLDIGTRSLVGTVGYKMSENNFTVVAQCVKEHDTRAMIDGQIHDIPKVTESIQYIKKNLEEQIGRTLGEVCIAAAGRVLKTITAKATYEFPSETVLLEEHVHSLELLGIEQAYDTIRNEKQEDGANFYCVGYTPVHYYLNHYMITNLIGHKAKHIEVELIATFLPEEVIDSLYSAVENANLAVANLTLEPIAAINVAIPDKFRLLNIALVDVGAGTSDISITRDGSITAYGMIPYAGDEITENIARKYLVEFNVAEKIKLGCLKKKVITYKDILGTSHKVTPAEVLEEIKDTVDHIAKGIGEKIVELNGNKPVSAVFVVGGGGKIPTFVSSLAKHIGIQEERVALRGAEVLNEIEFLQPKVKKDSLMVTPIGICLNFYLQKNNFITVTVCGERVKLYDNSKLTIVDAAIQVGYPNERLFPRRGKALHFTLDGVDRMVRGELGEAAVITLNGEAVGINALISQNDKIEIIESTVGADATFEIRQLPEYNGTISFYFNNKKISCPKYVMVNGQLVSEFYNICDRDEIKILNYYTLEQVLDFMDITPSGHIEVNNVIAGLDEKIYENFTINTVIAEEDRTPEESIDIVETVQEHNIYTGNIIQLIINGEKIELTGKEQYILVDILDFYYFDTSVAKGSNLVLKINGEPAEFTSAIQDKDEILMFWED